MWRLTWSKSCCVRWSHTLGYDIINSMLAWFQSGCLFSCAFCKHLCHVGFWTYRLHSWRQCYCWWHCVCNVQRWLLVCRRSPVREWLTAKQSTCCSSWCATAIVVCHTWSCSDVLCVFFSISPRSADSLVFIFQLHFCTVAPCGLRGCKNRAHSVPGLDCFVS